MLQFGSASTTVVLVLVAATAVWAADRGAVGARALRLLDALAGRRTASISSCAAFAFFASAAIALFVYWPEPVIHDEFSRLLAADTFAHARLTNPTHENWQHFESFHIFHEPSYASKYPPASSLLMAVGQVLTTHALVGVWLSGAAMAAALCWMLYAFVTPRWAFLGGLLATLQLGVTTYWTQSYWGGAVPAAAGALVFGAAARLTRQPRACDSFWLGVGLIVLANSRPFEGAVIASAPVAAVFWSAARSGRIAGRLGRTLGPAALVLVLGAAATAHYNRVVAGHWWMPPYVHHELLYAQRPALAFLPQGPRKAYRHRELRDYYSTDPETPPSEAREQPTADDGSRLADSPGASTQRAPQAQETPPYDFKAVGVLEGLNAARSFMTGRALLLPLFIGVLLSFRRGPGMEHAGLVLAVVAVSLSRYFRPHYIAPAVAPVFILVAVGMQHLSSWRVRRLAVGPVLCAVVLTATIFGMIRELAYDRDKREREGSAAFLRMRAGVVATLDAEPGRDLVVVRYGPDHDLNREWVYNAADIDAADVVWARDMGESGNRALIRHFADRKIWLLRVGWGAEHDGLILIEDPA